VVVMPRAVADDNRDYLVDEVALDRDLVDDDLGRLGLCGARDEPTGRRCFLRAGHGGRCALLRVSARGRGTTIVLPDARRGHDG
jgi:hypothetical protein